MRKLILAVALFTSQLPISANAASSLTPLKVSQNHASTTVRYLTAIPSIGWDTTATQHRGQTDQDFSYRCPSDGRAGTAYGSDIYTSDSSICTSAVHAGLITTKSGGVVTIKMHTGELSYAGTTRHGVTTLGWGNYNSSFIFVNTATKMPLSDPNVKTISWDTNAYVQAGRLDQDFSYHCLAQGRINAIYGTDTYTIDSSICTAAVHAGLITTKDGGTVTIRVKPGESSYTGTFRNGVTSQNWGSYNSSFVFVKKGE